MHTKNFTRSCRYSQEIASLSQKTFNDVEKYATRACLSKYKIGEIKSSNQRNITLQISIIELEVKLRKFHCFKKIAKMQKYCNKWNWCSLDVDMYYWDAIVIAHFSTATFVPELHCQHQFQNQFKSKLFFFLKIWVNLIFYYLLLTLTFLTTTCYTFSIATQ